MEYIYGERKYNTINEAAKDLGFNNKTISKYLKLANNDLEKAMELFYAEHSYCVIDGVRYSTQEELAESLEVTVTTLKKYIDSEGSIEKGVQKILDKRQNKTIYVFRGVEYDTLQGVSDATKIVTTTLRRLLKRTNGDVDKAYDLYYSRNKGKYKGYDYKGIHYSSAEALAKAFKIPKIKLLKRMKEKNFNVEEAVDELLKEKKERERKQKIKQIYDSVRDTTKISRRKLTKLVEISIETGQPIEELIKNHEKENKPVKITHKENRTYTYDGKTFNGIKALANYTGILEEKLGRYIRKYNRNAEKAIFMIRIRELRTTKASIKPTKESETSSQVTTQDLAIILGMKHNELIACLNQGMSIEEIKNMTSKKTTTNFSDRNSTLMYDEDKSLLSYCIQNNLNYSCIYYAMHTYGKTKEEAIENFRKNGQKIPRNWIFDKYGVLLKHLLLSESIDYKKIVANMRQENISLVEAIENYVLRQTAQKHKLDYHWEKELYSVLTIENLPEEEKQEFVKRFFVDEIELECIQESKTRIEKTKRTMLLYEIAECLKGKVFSQEEMINIFKEYDINTDEIETIYLDLYSKYDSGILLSEEQPENIKRQKIRDYIRKWTFLSTEEREQVKREESFTEEDLLYIEQVSNEMERDKRIVAKLKEEREEKQKY